LFALSEKEAGNLYAARNIRKWLKKRDSTRLCRSRAGVGLKNAMLLQESGVCAE
jgi:hypothetical protein